MSIYNIIHALKLTLICSRYIQNVNRSQVAAITIVIE